MIEFVVPGRPVAKARVNFDSRSSRAYTPAATVAYARLVGFYARRCIADPAIGPVRLECDFQFVRPKSSRNQSPVVKPDLSNLIKLVEDAMLGIAYKDDCQITEISTRKVYGSCEQVTVRVILLTCDPFPIKKRTK